MEKRILKPLTFGLALMSAISFTSCSEDDNQTDNGGNGGNGGEDIEVLAGPITSNTVLKSGRTYKLQAGVHVKAPAVLTIEKGVTIEAEDNGKINYILIEQGAQINAEGTADAPIVMTSENKKAGAWGGLHICGKAPINLGTVGKSEIGNADFGGSNANDNSGKLKYIRLEYTGVALNEDTESNGLTLYGVGNGTEISYIQAYKGSDDGIEFFGGTVNIDHCMVTSCSDDSYDWTYGWRGEGKYLIAYQEAKETLGYECDCLIEADNNGDNNTATPVSHPQLSNLTLVGNNSASKKNGVLLREGTYANIENAQITGKINALAVETKETENALLNGTAKLSNIAISGELSSNENIYTNDEFVKDGNLTNQTFSLTNNFIGMTDGRGAIAADNLWINGWTK